MQIIEVYRVAMKHMHATVASSAGQLSGSERVCTVADSFTGLEGILVKNDVLHVVRAYLCIGPSDLLITLQVAALRLHIADNMAVPLMNSTVA